MSSSRRAETTVSILYLAALCWPHEADAQRLRVDVRAQPYDRDLGSTFASVRAGERELEHAAVSHRAGQDPDELGALCMLRFLLADRVAGRLAPGESVAQYAERVGAVSDAPDEARERAHAGVERSQRALRWLAMQGETNAPGGEA